MYMIKETAKKRVRISIIGRTRKKLVNGARQMRGRRIGGRRYSMMENELLRSGAREK